MQQHFPRMWTAFSETIKPRAIKLASEQYYHRREAEAENFQEAMKDMGQALTKAAAMQGFEVPTRPDFVENLTKNYRVDWLHLLEALSTPLPEKTNQRLTKLFPTVFDPMYGASGEGRGRHRKPYLMRSFPHLKRDAETFATNVESILRDEGIEKFIEHYTQVWESFDQSIEDDIIKRRTR